MEKKKMKTSLELRTVLVLILIALAAGFLLGTIPGSSRSRADAKAVEAAKVRALDAEIALKEAESRASNEGAVCAERLYECEVELDWRAQGRKK